MYAQPTLNGAPSAPASYSNLSTFGSTSIRIIPISASYESGYLPGQGFPAENENYFMYNITNSINAIANDVSNIHAEILTILTGQAIFPDGTSIQLNSAIGSKITSTITATYINNALTGAGISTALQAYGGNVGIGKSPSYVLDVNGIVNGTDVYIAGVSITSLLALKAPLISPSFTTPTLGVASATDITISSLTASQSVQTDGSNKLISLANTGTGNNVLSASPTFTGSPLVPTQSPGDNSTKIASTAYVDSAILTPTFVDDSRITTGSVNRTETVNSMSVGQTAIVNWSCAITGGTARAITLAMPATGTYQFSLTVGDDVSNSIHQATPTLYGSFGSVAGGSTVTFGTTPSGQSKVLSGFVKRLT